VRAASALARGAGLGRYALWHLRDYLRDKGVATVITLSLIGYLNQVPISRARSLGMRDDLVAQISDQAFVSGLRLLAFLGVLFATNGIVADDRRNGYYKLLFSKPVSIVGYYTQKFVVYGLGFLTVAALLLTVYWLTVEPFFRPALLPALALVYVALGGIGFLLSAAWRFDWLSLAAVVGLSDILWILFADAGGWRAKAVRVLPPVHLLDNVYVALRHGQPLPASDLAWLAGYGLGCFLLGLVVIRRRPLVSA
jgi:ABC-type transport system involved in multi-copper enzyme maturation permease subunit